MKLASPQIINYINLNDISNVINDKFILTYDLSLYKYNRNMFKRSINQLFYVNDGENFMINSQNLNNYINIILDTTDYIKFMNPNNFAFNEDFHRIASFDFRILIDDLTGKVTKEDLLHIASISSLILSGKIDVPIGYQHIIDYLEKKGEVVQNFSLNGYMHIKILKKTNLFIKNFVANIETTSK